MPNHIHGIIVIEDNDFDSKCRDVPRHVSTRKKLTPPRSKSLSSVINHFKGAVTRQCNKQKISFQWQPRFYEHIIDSEDDYARIKEYIANNPINWHLDRNNPFNVK
jgi:REP element-mobilizing transposase RayT